MAVVPKLLKSGAALFVLALSAYSGALIYYNRHSFPTATIGATCARPDPQRAMRVEQLTAGGPGDLAGLRAGDRILAVDGQPLLTIYPFWDAVDRGQPGATVTLAVNRPEDLEVRLIRVQLEAPVVPTSIGGAPITAARLAALNVLSFYPIPFLVVAGVVLMQRFHDRHAWLVAILFASLIAGARPLDLEPIIHPALRKPLVAYCLLFTAVPPGALYCLFATFPERTPVDRHAPWLKFALLGLPLLLGACLAIATLLSNETPFYLRPRGRSPAVEAWVVFVSGVHAVIGYGLGLVSLGWNAFRGGSETRRRTRVMLWGTAGAILPFLIVASYAITRDVDFIDLPFWVWSGAIMALFLLPLSIAYAVVKHRVLEIPVLLRRSARYVVVRHAIVTVGIVVGIVLTSVFTAVLSRLPEGSAADLAGSALPSAVREPFRQTTETERRALSGIAGALFGVLIMIATRKGVDRVTRRVDRAFFREAYDARQLLQDLAHRIRTAVDRTQVAALLEPSLRDALHPSTILVLLRTSAGRLEPVAPPGGTMPPGLEVTGAERDLGIRGGVTVIRPGELPPVLAPFAGNEPDLVAPMLGYDERLEGLLLLGPRLAEEPYGREDRELIAAVAGQAGVALQNLRLATSIAERIEAERREAHELDIAREVQARLLPQHAPVFESLDYAGICIQARQVGGDYYDFLHLGPGRLGLVLADISGKGISAALLMASLQASLRSHPAQDSEDLLRVLHAANRTFFDSTETSRYATLFFGIYDEASARLRYANCGHVPPLLLGPDGSIDRLMPTAPVIGLFDDWRGEIREADLARGTTLVIFSDGVVEAFNADDEEFGENRLVDLLRQQGPIHSEALVKAILEAVRHHSGPVPSDDVTLVVARGLGHKGDAADSPSNGQC